MDNQVTTIEIKSKNAEVYNKPTAKLARLNLKDKIADIVSSFISELTISIVVTLFSLLIKTEALKCLSGFCYPNKSKKDSMKPINEIDILNQSITLMETKLSVKLINANRELILKRIEIQKSTAELILANKELTLQYKERGSLTAELIIANKKLAYQYGEREKREAELVIANKELVFQNEENKKNAVELIIAKREIAFNKLEKEIRASELIIANKKLIYKTQERQIKTAELNIANRELKKAEEKQNEYIKGLEEMIFMTSHKVRQPIANILGFSNMLNESINSPDEVKQSVNIIKQSAISLDTFTRELTTFMCELAKEKNCEQ